MKLKRFTIQLAAAGVIALPLMAQAAGLGKLSVTSVLGQPLAAEIELFTADQAEFDSLSANLASDQAFRDARVQFAPVLSSLRFSIEKKASGKQVLKVTSSRPVNDPFVDILIELNWPSGRLVREYTLLLDPPGVPAQQPAAPVVPAAAKTPVEAPKPDEAASMPQASAPSPAAADSTPAAPGQVKVKRGDTLMGIAKTVRPEGVSLERTLLGLYRDNSRAFDGNMNRLKAGRTLTVPSGERIAAISQTEAVREIKLQAADWRAYRQKLAAAAAPADEAAPGQTTRGTVTPRVEDRAKPAPEAQKDVLKLSRQTPPKADAGKASAGKADETRAMQEKLRAQEEDATAREKALSESNQRVASLEKQIQDMQDLVEMQEKAQGVQPSAPVAPPAPAVPAPVVKAPAPVVSPPVSEPEPAGNWFDPLLANPVYWGGALAALGLGGVLWWVMASGGRRRKTRAALDDSIMSGGDVSPTVMTGGASGGSVNTGDTSFLTDFSQAGLGTIDTHDVDPIAEAEVYMAYGRDAQAEEILKEAVGKNPDRPEIRVKLLEIYAARRNTSAYEAVAGELYAALDGKPSPLWDKACEMGRGIDPTNPLYGGVQSSAPVAATVAATAAVAGGALAFDTAPKPGEAAFGLADAAPEHTPYAAPQFAESVAEAAGTVADPVTAGAPLEFESAGHVLNFDGQSEPVPAFDAGVSEPAPAPQPESSDLDFDLADLDLPAAPESAAELDLDLDLGMGLENDSGPDSKFDFSGLDLDLGDAGGNDLDLDEAGTKLDLARAYVEMGDKEGAREILNEVLAEGSERQKSDAKALLGSLG